jgi:hypothetical protein
LALTPLANAINAVRALLTIGGAGEAAPTDFNFSIVLQCVTDVQFGLLVLASAWTALILRLQYANGIRQAALVTAGNLMVNLAFFVSHPVFTPYYTIPVAMLSLWSLLFASSIFPGQATVDHFPGRAARA